MDLAYIAKFKNLNYEQFKKMAIDPSLSNHERVGFPDIYRQGKELLIWQDIKDKLTNLNLSNKLILEIGPGCSQLPRYLLAHAFDLHSKVILCDSLEMLSQLPEENYIEKIEGPFPRCWLSLKQYQNSLDVILVYSVFHYIYAEGDIWRFLDCCFKLLGKGGQLLIGDVPNKSKRARFFKSEAGKEFHKKFVVENDLSLEQEQNKSDEKIDDALIMSIIDYARSHDFDAFIMPQAMGLPMANRREDILIVKV